MTEPLYRGIQGVNISWMATIPGMEDIEEMAEEIQRVLDESVVPGIEELAAALPEKCPKCDGAGWVERMCDFCTAGHSVRCDCQREEAKRLIDPAWVRMRHFADIFEPDLCFKCSKPWPCEPYELARSLQESQSRGIRERAELRHAGVMAWNAGVLWAGMAERLKAANGVK
jgi:hypothetical protein